MIFNYFSYWIFIWYILYVLHLIKYNPKIGLLFSLVANILLLLLMICYKTTTHLVLLLLFVMLFEKIIPLYTIWNTKIRRQDIYFFVILFSIYIAWIIINKQNNHEVINSIKNLIIYKKNTLPGMQLLEKMGL